MPAYLLLIVAVLSRLMPHPDWLNFTAVGGALLYFGARRSWREMLAPLAALMATDYCLTVFTYHYTFRWQNYVITWGWYVAAMVLGQILLRSRTTFVRVASGALLGPTSFFVVSNYAVWIAGGMYPRTLGASESATPLPCPSTATTCFRPRLLQDWPSACRCCCVVSTVPRPKQPWLPSRFIGGPVLGPPCSTPPLVGRLHLSCLYRFVSDCAQAKLSQFPLFWCPCRHTLSPDRRGLTPQNTWRMSLE